MMKKFLFLFLGIVFWTGLAMAQVTVTAELDKTTMSTEDEAYITLTVSGLSQSSDPVIPKVSGLNIIPTGRSSSFQIINGAMSSSSQYSFTVVPEDAATFVIPPFVLFSGGVEYKSNALTLTVQKNSGFYSQPTPQSPFPALPNPNGSSSRSAGEPFLISATVSNTHPKQHEQVLFKLKLAARQTADLLSKELPDFSDFYAVEVVPDKEGREVIDGESYTTLEIIYALFPLKSGKITLGESNIKLRYFVNAPQRPQFFSDPFFNRGSEPKTKILRAPAIDLTVAELPQPIPNDFTHLVGDFGVTTELSAQDVTVGDSVTYTIRLSGRGNISDGTLPEISIADAKVYGDKPNVEIEKSVEGLMGAKTFKLAIVPLQPGVLMIPALTLSYFDTEKQSYEVLNLEAQSISVRESQDQKTHAITPTINAESKTEKSSFDDAWLKSMGIKIRAFLPQLFYFSLFVLVILGVKFGITRWFHATKDRRTINKDRRVLFKKMMRVLGDESARDADVFHAIRSYFAAIKVSEKMALTAREMVQIARTQGVEAAFVAKLGTLLESFEAAQYGFEKFNLTQEMRAELKKILKVVQATT